MRFLLVLAFLCALAAPAAAQDIRELGDLRIVETDNDEFQLLWRGNEIAQLEGTSGAKIAHAFPSHYAPIFVVIWSISLGRFCDEHLNVVDLSGIEPRVNPPISACEDYETLWTGAQLIVSSTRGGVTSYVPSGNARNLLVVAPSIQVAQGVSAYASAKFDEAVRHLWPLRSRRWSVAPYLWRLCT